MNILVSGGGGFIGSHLVDQLLADKHNVTVIDISHENMERNLKNRNNLKVYCCDINNINKINDIGEIDQIVHLAALADIVPSIDNPGEYHNTNVNGTLQMLEFARARKVKKIIYAASSSCYGDNPPLPTTEKDPINTKYPYALTKWLGEEYCMHWHKVYGLPVISLRLFNVYGPRSRTTGAYGAVFGVFLKQKLEGKPYTIVGSGSQSRDFIYVSDVVDAIVLALNSNKVGEIYNIGSGTHSSIANLVNLLGVTNSVTFLPDRPAEPKTTLAWIGKAQEQLRFNPKIHLSRGVKIMIDNIESFKDAPLWNKENIAEATKTWFDTLGSKNANKL